MQSRGSVDDPLLVIQICEHWLWSIKLSWIIPVLQCQKRFKVLKSALFKHFETKCDKITLCSHTCFLKGNVLEGGAIVICYRCSLPLSPWAFTSSYAKHVLLSSNSSTVCCRDTFFLHFSLTVTFMFICSVQLWGIWRGCFPFFLSSLTSFLFSLLTKILMQICMPQWLSPWWTVGFLGTHRGKTPLQLYMARRLRSSMEPTVFR